MTARLIKRLTLTILSLTITSSITTAQEPTLTLNPYVHAQYGYIVNAEGYSVTEFSHAQTLLYTALRTQPVLAPDSYHLRLVDFTQVEGLAAVSCSREGTHLRLNLSGLVPEGMYSIWVLVFQEPGFDGTLVNRLGLGAFGTSDGSNNVYKASPLGRGSITVVLPPGPLSMTLPGNSKPYVTGGCLLTDAYEFHLIINYHIDGQTHGTVLGPPGTWAAQAGFIFSRRSPTDSITEPEPLKSSKP